MPNTRSHKVPREIENLPVRIRDIALWSTQDSENRVCDSRYIYTNIASDHTRPVSTYSPTASSLFHASTKRCKFIGVLVFLKQFYRLIIKISMRTNEFLIAICTHIVSKNIIWFMFVERRMYPRDLREKRTKSIRLRKARGKGQL